MKRIISLTAVFLLCICLLAVPAFAASASATLTGPGTDGLGFFTSLAEQVFA